ncbi:ribulose-phosphate 3-epimerase [Candidatus Peregrinibacteria bacterium]|nr:ribulose-phosphate 3-epimerase [Candidatus Peregrinibacteria bacterium]MBT7736611.1 ribulose-phosphate 3-epimerase [Candidatus Peregrinibacteria bacterium]
MKIAPSILSADFGDLNAEIEEIQSHCDQIHVDVMDGHFVPNITIGAPVVACLTTALPLNTHLMIENPMDFVEDFVKAGSDRIVIHVEAVDDLRAAIEEINSMDVESGVSIKPGTPVSEIKDVLDIIDEVLVMTVEPGFGGQSFMEDMVPKITELRELGFEGDIGIDGGINAETAKICSDAGANLLIAGSYIFGAKDRVDAIYSLKD